MALFIKKNGSMQQVAIGHEISKPEQQKNVSLDLASGDQIVTPDNGQVLTQVLIKKPETLLASNIKKDVNIAGVVGSYEAQDYLLANMEGQRNIDYVNDTTTTLYNNAVSYFSCFKSMTFNAVTSFSKPASGYGSGGDYISSCYNVKTISFNALTEWKSSRDGRVIVSCNDITQCNFPNLETVLPDQTGSSYSLLYSITSQTFTEITFPKLKNCSGRLIDGALYLANLYFPSLETISVPSTNSYGTMIMMFNFRTDVKVFLPKIKSISASSTANTMQFERYSGSNYTLELHIGEVGSTTQIAFGSHAFRGIPGGYSSIYIYGDVMPTLASNSFYTSVTGINVYVANASVKTAMENDTNWADAVSSGKITISLFTPS